MTTIWSSWGLRKPVVVLLDDDLCGDEIAGVKFTDDAGVFELVGHSHGFHEAGDGLVVEGDVGGVGADDLATDWEGLLGEFGGGVGVGVWRQPLKRMRKAMRATAG